MGQAVTNLAEISGLDRDVFCLQCGYNLRGLSGDPIRCPECGYNNDLGVASIPADLIRTTLHQMETYPTWCVVMSLGLAFMVIPAATGNPAALLLAGIGAASCLYGWKNCYRAATHIYPDAWFLRRLLLAFHLISATCILPFVLPPFVFRSFLPARPGVILLFLLISLLTCWTVGIVWYGRVRRQLATTQRETAVRIARSCLQNWRWRRGVESR